MREIISYWFSWTATELILSCLVFFAYKLLGTLKTTSLDKYRFLRISILLLPLIPFIPLPSYALISASSSLVSKTLLVSKPIQIFRESHQGRSLQWLLASLMIIHVFLLIWGLLRIFVSLVKAHIIVREGRSIGTHNGLNLIVHDLSVPPATIGFFRPQILIPRQIYEGVSSSELAMILRHEEIHVRRNDYLMNCVAGVFQALLSFSPISYKIVSCFRAEMEISCDKQVLKGGSAAKDYGTLLLNLISRVSPRPDLVYSGLFVSNSLITRRIEAMKNINDKTRPAITWGLFLLVMLTGAYGAKAVGLQPSTDSMVSPSWDPKKELRLGVGITIDTENGVGKVSTKVKMSLNFDEVGSIVLGGKKVDLKLTKTSGSPEIEITLYDEKGNVAHHSAVPFEGEAGLSAKLDPATGMHKIDVKILQL